MTRYKFILVTIFTTPFIVSFGIHHHFIKASTQIPYLIGMGAILSEICFLKDVDIHPTKDKGILSGLFISLTLAIICLWASYRGVGIAMLWTGTISTVTGISLRIYSKCVLGNYFSHSLRILPGHELIVSGLLKFIRHPAYSGTILIAAGFGAFINFFAGILLFLISTMFALARIKREEQMLSEQFPEQYPAYRKESWKIFPFLLSFL